MSLVKTNKRRNALLSSPFRNDPFFADMMDTRRIWDRFINNDENQGEMEIIPAMNIKENDKNIHVEMAAPGLTKDDFKITLDEGILTVSAEKEEKEEEEKKGFVRKEFSYNTFSRSVSLPETVDEDKEVEATYRDGVLKMNIFKKENQIPKKPKSIRVN